jgi:hypothetical protein
MSAVAEDHLPVARAGAGVWLPAAAVHAAAVPHASTS